jgi:hypothetical protein
MQVSACGGCRRDWGFGPSSAMLTLTEPNSRRGWIAAGRRSLVWRDRKLFLFRPLTSKFINRPRFPREGQRRLGAPPQIWPSPPPGAQHGRPSWDRDVLFPSWHRSGSSMRFSGSRHAATANWSRLSGTPQRFPPVSGSPHRANGSMTAPMGSSTRRSF